MTTPLNTITINLETKPARSCGGCTACCKLLPVRELQKPANTKCRHQTFAKGCGVYHKPGMPPSCMLWTCRWLINNDTGHMSRPDRSHYVIDIMPDYIKVTREPGAEPVSVEVVQIWCDPRYPDAHRDPDLRAYLARRGEEGIAGLVRYSALDGFTIIPPAMMDNGQWFEHHSTSVPEKTHSARDVLSNLAKARRVILG
jgi:hypothetical protein